MNFYHSREFIELLLAQPIPRRIIFLGMFLGISLSLSLSLLLAWGCRLFSMAYLPAVTW
jgi:Cu-processing system permease protein